MTNKCPHPRCKVMKLVRTYACREHWFSLPITIRKAISRAFGTSAGEWLKANEMALKFWNGEQ